MVFCLLLIWAGWIYSAQADDTALTLEQVIGTALHRNPAIAISRQEVEASRARVTQAYSAYLPQVAANTGYTRRNQWMINFFNGTKYRYQDNDILGALSVSQYLYDFGQTSGRVEQSRFGLSASEKAIDKTIADTVRDVKKSYFEVLKKQSLVQVNKESVRIQEEHLDQARAFFKEGVRPRIDVTKAEVGVANSRLNLIHAEYALRSSRLDLENLLGGPPVEGTYRLTDTAATSSREDIQPVEELAAEADSHRPEFAILKDQLHAAQAQLKSSQGGRWPSITAKATGGWENINTFGLTSNDDFPLRDVWQIGVNVTWPLFTGYRVQGKIAESQAEISKLESKQRQLELLVFNEVSTAYLGVKETEESIKTAELAQQQAKENMDLADGRYRNGVGNAIEYSDAELALTQAKSNLVQASYLYHQRMADLDYAVGR